MKAISLTQPWASLMAISAKGIETRTWGTSHRGWLAIHAAKAMPGYAIDFAWNDWVIKLLIRDGALPDDWTPSSGGRIQDLLPRGAIVGAGNLHTVGRVCPSQHGGVYLDCRDGDKAVNGDELSFGNFTPNRYGWVMSNVFALREPIPCRGALGLWDIPDAVMSAIRAQGIPVFQEEGL